MFAALVASALTAFASGAGGPVVRIGLAVGAESVTVEAPSGLVVEGGEEAFIALSGSRLVLKAGEDVSVEMGGFRRSAGAWTLRPHTGESLVVGGTAYRGAVEVARDETGVTVVNVLPLEDYLRGVVPREMPVSGGHLEALRAQAVASRTYAVRNLGRRAALGFDLWATVEDQVYGGASAETALADLAVATTSGVVLVDGSGPIRAYYHGACGGRTASIADVWGETEPPAYLLGVDDLDESGVPFCAAAPRLAWTETYPFLAVEVLDRDPSGRVRALGIGDTVVAGDAIRRAIRRPGGGILRSTRFEVRRAGGAVVLEGAGNGHGVGMCQWGAIGRARRGASHEEILRHYYPGTRLDTDGGGGGASSRGP